VRVILVVFLLLHARYAPVVFGCWFRTLLAYILAPSYHIDVVSNMVRRIWVYPEQVFVYRAPTDVWLQIFLTFFKTLEGKTLIVELKNDLRIQGVLSSVDQYHNLKLTDVTVLDKERFPQLVSHPSFSPLDS
jgi:small nuclear ribonucleoprotein (snRNP)-like protein